MQLDREIAAGGWYIAKQLANSSVIFDWPHLVCIIYHATQKNAHKPYTHTLSIAILYAHDQQPSMPRVARFPEHHGTQLVLTVTGRRAGVYGRNALVPVCA